MKCSGQIGGVPTSNLGDCEQGPTEDRGIRVVSRTTTALVGSQTWNVEVPSRRDLKEECHGKDDAKQRVEVLHRNSLLKRLAVKSVDSTRWNVALVE